MNTDLSFTDGRKYTRPGVYLESTFQRPRRDPFTTGVPVFIGLFKGRDQKLAAGDLLQLALWSHFADYVGKAGKDCRLGYAVRGFFQNGGRRCYVIIIPDVEVETVLRALELAAKYRSIDLVCVTDLGLGDAAIELQNMILAHCDEVGDRFAILDSSFGDDPATVAAAWSALDGTNGALYYPWILVRSFEGGDMGETKVFVPPCGHIAGLYARTDQNRGVHKAPANDVLEGVLSLEPIVTHAGHEESGPSRINRIRSFPGRGIRVWGARTLSPDDAWTYVNVRRLFLTALRWLDWHMTDLVFEPNDPKLWSRIEGELHQYFRGLYRQGALQGLTPAEAYYVKCDRSNNPRESIEQGKVVAEIGLAANTPFEFVVVRLIYGASGVSISGPIRPEQNS